jgi:hypothetical protein
VAFGFDVALWPVTGLTCNDALLGVTFSPSSPLKLRLLYRLAGSVPPMRITCVSSALLARLWAGFDGCGELAASELPFGVGWEAAVCEFPSSGRRCVEAVEPVGTLLDESVLPAPRRYRPGDGFTGESPTENERSRFEVERVIDGAMLSIGFLASPSSLVAAAGPAEERLEDPDVDTVESEEEEGWEG